MIETIANLATGMAQANTQLSIATAVTKLSMDNAEQTAEQIVDMMGSMGVPSGGATGHLLDTYA